MYYGIAAMNDEVLAHYGIGPDDNPPGRGSGRYPKGSGENPYQHELGLSGAVRKLREEGASEPDIAKGLGFRSTGQLRAALSMEKNRKKGLYSVKVPELAKQGYSVKEIAEKTGLSQSSVRNYLDENRKIQLNKTENVAEALKAELKNKRYIDVGRGVDLYCGCSEDRLKNALYLLEAEGYQIHTVNVPQMGSNDRFTTFTVLGDKDTEWSEVVNDVSLIKPFQSYVISDGEGVLGFEKPKSIDSSRVYINYTDESGKGGAERDGLIELRRGVEDISLGKSLYSQVRIGVDDKSYMKGMAAYSDRIPDGYDIIYNTNKKYGTPPEDVFKPMQTKADGSINWDNPFGATIKPPTAGGQRHYTDENGNDQLSVINKVGDQGDWGKWSKTVSPQILTKQPTSLSKRQLDLTYKDKRAEFDEIMALTNPTVKKKLLYSFAEDCDASAVHLKAKAFARQGTDVLLPVPSLQGGEEFYKKNGYYGEVYAPNYEHGEMVALFRFPHASTSEIPVLKVNNKNKEARDLMGNAPDAIGINAKVAEKLSGADFDGDTVVIIPIKSANIKSSPTLEGLKNFNPKDYKNPDAPKVMPQEKQMQMGITTNLIADMGLKGATPDEMARAIRHSMVVIDSEKHHLDYKQSEIDHRIQELKDKYQDGGGASTLVTRAGSDVWIPKRKVGSMTDPETGEKYYGINPKTGEKIWEDTGKTKKVHKPTKKDPDRMVEVPVIEKLTAMSYYDDASVLLSSKSNPHPTEVVYMNYANQMKALANEARRAYKGTPSIKRDPEATKAYAREVASLNDKLYRAKKNAPKERLAQIIANVEYKNQVESNPDIKNDPAHLKRLRGQCLTGARTRVGAKKERVDITDKEWEAIQNRAISETKLMEILNNANEDRVRELATPRRNEAIPPSIEAAIRAMASRPNGPTQKEIADQFGISPSAVSKVLKG